MANMRLVKLKNRPSKGVFVFEYTRSISSCSSLSMRFIFNSVTIIRRLMKLSFLTDRPEDGVSCSGKGLTPAPGFKNFSAD